MGQIKKYYKVKGYPIKEETLIIREDYSMEDWGMSQADTLLQTLKVMNPDFYDVSNGLKRLMLRYYNLN